MSHYNFLMLVIIIITFKSSLCHHIKYLIVLFVSLSDIYIVCKRFFLNLAPVTQMIDYLTIVFRVQSQAVWDMHLSLICKYVLIYCSIFQIVDVVLFCLDQDELKKSNLDQLFPSLTRYVHVHTCLTYLLGLQAEHIAEIICLYSFYMYKK